MYKVTFLIKFIEIFIIHVLIFQLTDIISDAEENTFSFFSLTIDLIFVKSSKVLISYFMLLIKNFFFGFIN